MEDIFLRQLVQLIDKYKWIWNIKVTHLFLEDHLTTHLPPEWSKVLKALSVDELHCLPSNKIESLSLPQSLCEFLSQCQCLSLISSPHPLPHPLIIRPDIAKGMKLKKQHEVSHLGAVVRQKCEQLNCQTVLDIGAGLGYLGHCLVHQCDLNVLSIERELDRVKTANDKRPIPYPSVTLNIEDTPYCIQQLRDIIESSNSNVCLTGLHCCGDLSPSILSLFSHLSDVLPLLILVPCCYHKRTSLSPLSHTVRKVLAQEGVVNMCGAQEGVAGVGVAQIRGHFPSVYGLRLAAQDSYESWQLQSSSDHLKHRNHVIFRALIEIALQHDILKPISHQIVPLLRTRICHDNFDTFLSDFINLVSPLLPISEMTMTLRHFLIDIYHKYTPTFPLIEPFTALQVSMQHVLESFVLLDYILYLRERGVTSAELVTVFDEGISPRCMAIIAENNCLRK